MKEFLNLLVFANSLDCVVHQLQCRRALEITENVGNAMTGVVHDLLKPFP